MISAALILLAWLFAFNYPPRAPWEWAMTAALAIVTFLRAREAFVE